MKTRIVSIEQARNDYDSLRSYLFSYKLKYGEDAYCRIGKQILEETKRKVFDEKNFRFLCALSSVLGKKSLFKRVTKEILAVRMLGYKTKDICCAELVSPKILSRGQIDRLTKRISGKELFSKFTYSNRITFYSTKLNTEELRLAVMNSLVSFEKKESSTNDKDYSLLIKAKIDNMKKTKREKPCTERADIRALRMR